MGRTTKMAAVGRLRSALLLRKVQKTAAFQAARAASHFPAPWNYMWMPGPCPKTEEEHVAAAKKYGMLREDYRPFPDDGNGIGDYPDMGYCSGASRPGNMWWDDEDIKINWGAPVQGDVYFTKEVGWDNCSFREKVTPELAFCVSMGWIGLFFFLVYITKDYPVFQPCTEEQTPTHNGGQYKKFYTFEKPE